MLPNVKKLNRSNIVRRISKLSMEDMLVLWQNILDERAGIPPNDRHFELSDMLENHVVPAYQTYQGINVVEHRASGYLTSGPDHGYNPLSPEMLKLVKSIQRRMKKAALAAAKK